MKSSLRVVLLALLSLGPDTGYGLGRRLSKAYAHAWSTTLQQIYGQLALLERDGLASHELASVRNRPDKKTYELTPKGTATIQAWLSEVSDPPLTKDTFPIKLASTPATATDLLTRQLEHRRSRRERDIVALRAALEDAKREEKVGYRLGLEWALALAEGEASWCNRATRRLHGSRSD